MPLPTTSAEATRAAKSFPEVLHELNAEKGTRYNPAIMDIITNTPVLKEKLNHILGEGRLDIMYKAYSDYLGV